jgi:hypothetical protein
VPGEDPTWGADATDWAQSVTTVLNFLIGPGDILPATFSLDNNVSIASNISGLLFDPGTIRSANIDYAVYRTSDSTPSGKVETGRIYIVYDDNATAGQKWKLAQTSSGVSGVVFSIADSGQFSYVSSDIGSANYTGTIRFSAKALTKI